MGKRIVELRESFGITQAKLAKSLGMHVNAISRIERGVVRLTEKILK
ncbi:MAG: helix-turn-helix domain-containing protein [Lachnospiraceae bacterium]